MNPDGLDEVFTLLGFRTATILNFREVALESSHFFYLVEKNSQLLLKAALNDLFNRSLNSYGLIHDV